MQCASCGSVIEPGSTHCTACGALVPLPCPSCGYGNDLHAKFCSECGHRLLADDAERRQLTVMFCDLVGSTELASRLDPEELREVVASVLRRIANIVGTFDGFVAEYLGDGVLVYFGYPGARENDAESAIRAGLQVVEEVPLITLLDGYRPAVRVGIATGLVVVGATGDAAIRNAAGSTPHLAARLQSLAQPGAVVIASSTWALTHGLFEFRDLGLTYLKGFAEPIRAWQVQGAVQAESRFEAVHQAGLTPMVDREAELALLWDQWCRADDGQGRVVLLSGEPGIGKSRLTAMLMQRLAGKPHIRLRYFCSPHLQGSPMHPFIQQLERAAGFSRGDSPVRKVDLLEAAFDGSASTEDVALFADLLSLPAGDKYPKPQMSAQKRKEKTMEALLRLMESFSRRQTLLIIFEDAHWSDPTSQDLLALAVERAAGRPVLLIITFRPEFNASWDQKSHVSGLTLGPLSREEGVALVEGIAGESTLARPVIEDIVERTDGLPLFLEELTKAVLEVNRENGDQQRVLARTPHHDVTVPATLHASLMTRLDRLGDAKEIAQIGAALGREFSYELLAAVAEKDPADLRTGLDRLIQSGLIFAIETSSRTSYLFKHALVQDAAYGMMLRAKRQKLHQRIVQVLETTFAETRDVQPELLAHHCMEAGLTNKAIGYWLTAGLRALARSTMQEALVWLGRGLRLIEELPDSRSRHQMELDFQIARGKALITTKGYAVQITGTTFDRAYQLCCLLDNPPQLLSVLHGQWTHALLRGDMVSARRRAEELLRQGEARNDEVWLLMGCRFIGVTCYPLGDFATGRDHLERGLKLFNPARRSMYSAVTVDDAEVVMLTYLAYALLYLGDVDQARQRCAAAQEQARQLAQPYSLTHALVGTAFIEYYLGYPRTALEHLARLLALTAEHGIVYYTAVGTILRGACLVAAGFEKDGIDALAQGLDAYRATGSTLYLPSWLAMFAAACGTAHQVEQGLRLVAEALECLEATGMRNDESEVRRVRGDLLFAVHDIAGAESSYREALAVAHQQHATLMALRAAMRLASLLDDRGNRAEARDVLEPAHLRITEGFDISLVKEAKVLLEKLV